MRSVLLPFSGSHGAGRATLNFSLGRALPIEIALHTVEAGEELRSRIRQLADHAADHRPPAAE